MKYIYLRSERKCLLEFINLVHNLLFLLAGQSLVHLNVTEFFDFFTNLICAHRFLHFSREFSNFLFLEGYFSKAITKINFNIFKYDIVKGSYDLFETLLLDFKFSESNIVISSTKLLELKEFLELIDKRIALSVDLCLFTLAFVDNLVELLILERKNKGKY